MEDVVVYSLGLVYASVCSALPAEETVRIVNEVAPSGTENGWTLAAEPFASGEPNPCPCEHDARRQHFLVVC